MVDIQSPTAEIRRGKKNKEERKIEITGQKYNGLPYLHRATIISIYIYVDSVNDKYQAGLVKSSADSISE